MEREHALQKLFEGYKTTYYKFFQIEREEKTPQATGYRLKHAEKSIKFGVLSVVRKKK